MNVIRNVELELDSKIADLTTKLDFETKARDSNVRRLEQRGKKLAELLGVSQAPLFSDEELAKHNLPDVEFKCASPIPPSGLVVQLLDLTMESTQCH